MHVKGRYEGKIEDLSMELCDWGIDVIAVTETQLRERVDMCCDKNKMIGMGRWMKRGDGVGILIRNDLKFEIDELNVGNCMMSEDILAMRMEYNAGKKRMSQIMVVCYMTTAGPDDDYCTRGKYEIVKKVMRENEHEMNI